MIQYVSDHWTVFGPALGMAGIGILDLIFAKNPNWKSNGLGHWVALQLGWKDPS